MNILCFAPHTDDETLGAGGMLARHGGHVVAFSDAGQRGIRDEFYCAIKRLRTTGDVLDFKTRHFGESRQEILDTIIEYRETNPDLVICPSMADVHQDHQVIATEVVRAFKNRCTIIAYAHPWNIVAPDPRNMAVILRPEEIRAKKEALACYSSQSRREYFANDDWMRMYGRYVERYEVIQWRE